MSKSTPKKRSFRQERSAGLVLYRLDNAAPDGMLFLLLDYGRYWDYPKGHVEKGEDDRTAALRELHEETGIRDVRLVEGFLHEIQYFFRKPRKGLVRKTVIFFLARTSEASVRISSEHEGYAWLDAEAALQRLKYATAVRVFQAARQFLADAAL